MTDSMAQRVLIYVVIVLMAARVIKIQDFVRKDAILTLCLHSAKVKSYFVTFLSLFHELFCLFFSYILRFLKLSSKYY